MANKLDVSNIIFRFRPHIKSFDRHLLNYIKSFTCANDMVLKAVRAYWLPIAAKHRGFRTGDSLKRLATESVIALYSRAEELCEMFEIDPTVYGYSRKNTEFVTYNPPALNSANSKVVASNLDSVDESFDGNGNEGDSSEENEIFKELGISPRNFNLAGL